MYTPLTLARTGMAVSSARRQDDVQQRMPFSTVQVGAEGGGVDEHVFLHVVQPHAQNLLGLVDQGSHVEVLMEAGLGHEIARDLHQLRIGQPDIHEQHVRGLSQPAEVILHAKEVEILILGVPVGADALKDGRPVVERVRHDVDIGVGEREQAPLVVCVWGLRP